MSEFFFSPLRSSLYTPQVVSFQSQIRSENWVKTINIFGRPTLKISSPAGSSNNLSKATAHLATLPSTEFTMLHAVTLAEEE